MSAADVLRPAAVLAPSQTSAAAVWTVAGPIRTDRTLSREGRGGALPLPLHSDPPPHLGYAQTRYPAAPLGSPVAFEELEGGEPAALQKWRILVPFL